MSATASGADRRAVVITGLGAVTPSGVGVAALWEAVAAGRSAVGLLEGAEFADLPVRIGGTVADFDLGDALDPGLARRLSPVQLWAVAAADEALAQAGVWPAVQGAGRPDPRPASPPWHATRFSIIAATGSGPVDAMQAATRAFDDRGHRAVPLTLSVYGSPDSAAGLLSQRYGAFGAAQGVSAACASGAIGLGEGLRRIRHGYADAVLVVGMEDCLNPVNIASNTNLRALARGYESAPAAACRPFDLSRSGFVMSQGAAAILLESEEVARARGARVLAELSGFGASSDAHHATSPHPEGRGGAIAVRDCLADAGMTAGAGVAAEHIDHVNAHGTGTPAGDAAELAALAAALGSGAREIPTSATKSITGHLLGASGVVEAAISVMSLHHGLIPPTLNLDDPEFPDWDIVTGSARRASINTVLSTSFGFGGHNGALLLRRGNADPRRDPPPDPGRDRAGSGVADTGAAVAETTESTSTTVRNAA